MSDISTLQQQIANYNSRISVLNSKIKELNEALVHLNTLKTKLEKNGAALTSKATSDKQKLNTVVTGLMNTKRYSKSILTGYGNSMNESLKGTKYKKALKSMDASVELIRKKKLSIQQEIKNHQLEISALQSSIASCNAAITQLQNAATQA